MHELREAAKKAGKHSVTEYVELLSYLVKKKDKDGLDLHYFNSRPGESIFRCERSSALVTSVRQRRFTGTSSPEGTLKKILDGYGKKLREHTACAIGASKRWSLHRSPRLPKPLSVYVLTDAVWESPNSPDEYLHETLRDLIQNLCDAGCHRTQVGIQFIRFGDNPYGVQRLKDLDNLGSASGVDM